MRLDEVLDRCRRLEERAAAVYRTFAESARRQPEVCALWTDLAREEEQHAASLVRARTGLSLAGDPRTSLEGWLESLTEVEERLQVAERLGAAATIAQQLAAALDLEMTEVESFRQAAIAAANAPDRDPQESHANRLADAAEALTDDPHIRLQVALVRARIRLHGR